MCIQASSFEWRINPENVEYRPLKDILSKVVSTFINKKFLKFKNPSLMNFELGGHIIWNAELKKKKQNLQKKL